MKKLGIIALVLALAVSVFVAGCAPVAAPAEPSTLPELSEEQPVAEISEAPTSEAPSEAPAEDAAAGTDTPTAPTVDLIGTEWEVYKAIAADGSEITNPPYSAYEFGVYGYAIEYMGDTQEAGTFEQDGDSVTIHIGDKTMLGTFQNGELEIYEGKGAYVYQQVEVPVLAGTTWNYFIDVDHTGAETDNTKAFSLQFGADGKVKGIVEGTETEGTYTQDGKNFSVTIDDQTKEGTVSYQQMLLIGESNSIVLHPQTPDVAGMTWAMYECNSDTLKESASYAFGTDGTVEYRLGDSLKGTYTQDGDSIRIDIEGSDPVLGSVNGFDMRILMSEGDVDFFAPVFQ